MFNKLITLAIVGVIGVVVLNVHNPLAIHGPHLSLPTVEGQTKTMSNLDKLQSNYTSKQGYVAGRTDYEGIYVHQVERTIKQIPAGLMGSCATLKNGQGAVTYSVNMAGYTPTVTGDDTLGYTVTLPRPQPLSVGITAFDTNAIKKARTCGLLSHDDVDVQAINREVQRNLCQLANGDMSQLTQREADAQAMVTKDAAMWGVTAKVTVAWVQPPTTPTLKECQL